MLTEKNWLLFICLQRILRRELTDLVIKRLGVSLRDHLSTHDKSMFFLFHFIIAIIKSKLHKFITITVFGKISL